MQRKVRDEMVKAFEAELKKEAVLWLGTYRITRSGTP